MAESVWLLTMAALDASNAAKTLRFSDGAYVDGSNNLYIKRLKTPALMTVSPSDGGVLKIFAGASIGEIELDNTDGGINYLAGYAIDGRTVTIDLFDGISTVTNYFSGTCANRRESNGSIYITLNTLKDTLDTDHPQSVYGGSNSLPNGVDGVAGDIKGSVRPRCYGSVRNVTPKCVNTSKLIYEGSARASSTVPYAYDRGVSLTRGADYTSTSDMQVTAPSAGQFRCYQGLFRLGSAPVGTITCDIDDTSNLAGDVFAAICTERSISTDSASVTLLNSIGSVGLFIDSTTKTADMLDTLIKGLGYYWYFVGSTVYAKKLALAVTSTFTVNHWQIEKIDRRATGLGANGLPVSSVKIQCDKIETVQNDLNGTSVSADRVARMLNQWRKTEQNSSATLTRHPLSKTIEIDSALRNISDAAAVATSLLNVLSVRCDWVEINVNLSTLPALSIGAGFTVYTYSENDELGYSAGKLLTLIGYESDLKNNSITLWGIG